VPLPSETSLAPSPPWVDAEGPCPGHGYTCDDCVDGWFCPPIQTPAWPAPCGYGWPCYQCKSGWFCVPLAGDTDTTSLSASGPTSSVMIPTSLPATIGYQYAGCYADDFTRVLSESEILDVPGGMTNEECVKFCKRQGLTLAGTEDGAQCFCGNVLIGSALLPSGRCNIPCTGDLDNSTVCGGPWALSVWGPGGIARGEPEPVSLLDFVGDGANGVRYSPAFENIAAASEVTSGAATGKVIHPNSTDFPLGLGHIIPGNSTTIDSHGGAMHEPSAENWEDSVNSMTSMTMSSKKRGWAPRGRTLSW
jgi:hypothetical protein